MTGFAKLILLFLIFLIPTFSIGKKTDSIEVITRARELGLKGGELFNDGLYYQALDTFKLFLDYRKKIYDEPKYSLGSPYMLIGVSYKNLGQYNLALENFEAARLNYLDGKNRQSTNLAKLYINSGNVYRAKLDFKNALTYFEQGLSIFLSLEPIDPIDVSDAYYSIAEVYYLQNNYNDAIQILHKNLHKGDEYIQIYYYELLALIYQNLDKNTIALKNYQEAIKLTASVFDDSDLELGMIYMNYAEFLNSISSHDESFDVLRSTYDIIKISQPLRGKELSRYYELLGGISQDKIIETQQINRFKTQKKANLYEAISWYTKSLNALSSSTNDINLDSLRIEECISFLDVLAILQQIGDAYYELALIDKEDKSNFYKNSLVKALDYYNAASQLTQQARREISSDESKIQLAELEYHTFSQTIEIAYLALEATGENKYLELAFNNSEQLKSSAIFDKISDDIAQENSLIPDSLLQLQNKLNGIISIYNQKIFEEKNRELPDSLILADLKQKLLIEKSKIPDTTLIYSYTQKIAIENNKQLPNNLLIENYRLKIIQEENKRTNGSLISEYNELIFEESNKGPDSVLIKEYNDKIFTATRERDELNRLLEEEYSDYYDLKYSNSMLSITDIQKEMDKNEAILEYVIVEPDQDTNNENKVETNSQLYTFLITKFDVTFSKNSISEELDNSIEDVFNFMSTPAYLFTTNNDSKEFCISSHQLYKLLIEAYEKELLNKSLIIIPDGKLNYISFDGLLRSLPDTSKTINFSKLDYLINDFNINYANSANILFKNRNKSQKFKNNTLAFAPEYNSEKFDISGTSYTLMPLPGVQREVDAIAETIKTKIFRGNQATEQNFRENCMNSDILHLAMHAYINDSLPAFSRLAFSPNEETDLNKDGWLNTTDIYNLELNARMAVLSACNTGVGKLQKGEGMMSLARGFLFAGCPSIIMSLWEVEDESGTQIMTSFYKNLKKGKSKDEALRLAKLSYIKNSNSRLAHPHYWMSFKSIGDNSPIYNSYDIYFFALLILLIIAFTIDQSLRIRKTRRSNQKL